jgi:hypothetical protein
MTGSYQPCACEVGCPLQLDQYPFHSGGFHVRFTPESGRLLRRRGMTLCATSDQSAVQRKTGRRGLTCTRAPPLPAALP